MAKRPSMSRASAAYPSDVTDEEWSFVVPYLTLNRLDGEHRKYGLRAAFNAARRVMRSAAPWRMLPHDLPPWPVGVRRSRHTLAAFHYLAFPCLMPSLGWARIF